MHLHLSLPPSNERTSTAFEIDAPQQLRARLDSSAADHSSNSVRELLALLTSMNRARIRVTLRQELSEIFNAYGEKLLPELSESLSQGTVPLSGDARSTVALADEWLTELAYSYKLLLMEQSRRLFGFASSGRALLPVTRAMQLLAARLILNYRSYSSSPKSVWQELHELYQFALRRGFAQRSGEAGEPSPLLIYRNALLLAFAEPLKLMPGDLDRVLHWASNFGDSAVLAPAEGQRNGQGLFLIKPQRDLAGYPLAKHQHPPAQTQDLMFNSLPLSERLLEQLSRLYAGTQPAQLGLPAEAAEPPYRDLMARLVKHWGAVPNRKHARLRTHTRVEVCIGIRGIWHFLNASTGCSDSGDWMIANESQRGFALIHMGGQPDPVSVGEVVGIRNLDNATCHVCVVRWVHSDSAEHLELGVEELSDAARAGSIRQNHAPGQRNPEPILLLPEVSSLSATPAILSPLLNLDRTCEMNLGDLQSKVRVKATRMLERTTSIQLLQFSTVG